MNSELIYVLTPGTVIDPYSTNPEPSWEVPPTMRAVMTLAPPEPRPATEPVQDARNASTNGWTLYLPMGEVVTAEQRVRVRGEDFPVVGIASVWGDAGVVVQAYRVEG